MTHYEFYVKTGSQGGAGTDGDLLLQIIGKSGRSPSQSDHWWNLDNDGDDLEAGDWDRYKFDNGDVGDVKHIFLWFKHRGGSDDWYFEEAHLFIGSSVYYFPYHDWIRESKLLILTPGGLDLRAVQSKFFEIPKEFLPQDQDAD